MKRNFSHRLSVLGLLSSGLLLLPSSFTQAQTTNSWVGVAPLGYWDWSANWSAGAPDISQAALFITNGAPSKTVRVTSPQLAPGTLTVSNLTVGAPIGRTINTLELINLSEGPLRILNGFTITSGGQLMVGVGGTNIVKGLLTIGDAPGATGTVWVTGGQLAATNAITLVGYNGVGQMTVSNGTARFAYLEVARNPTACGTFTVASGSSALNYYLAIGDTPGATGTVWVTGGQLTVTNDSTYLGYNGVGQMAVSNGAALFDDLIVAWTSTACGTFTAAGGSSIVNNWLILGSEHESTGTVWVTGGQLTATNDYTLVGYEGVGQMTVSNGTARFANLTVGNSFNGCGTFTAAGGTNAVNGLLTVSEAPGVTGTVWVTGGQLIVTNDSTLVGGDGVGQMTVSNGTVLLADLTVASNATARGTLTVAGGTNIVKGLLTIGDAPGATGTVWATGGQLTATNQITSLGEEGVGQMTVSNGLVTLRALYVAVQPGSGGTLTFFGGNHIVQQSLAAGNLGNGQIDILGGSVLVGWNMAVGNSASGTLTVSGGSLDVLGQLWAGGDPGGTGKVVVSNGGQLNVTNGSTRIGDDSVGRLTASKGNVRLRNAFVGLNPGAAGTFTVSGATVTVPQGLRVGNYSCHGPAIVEVLEGSLLVTNAANDAVLEVRGGTLTQSGGELRIDQLVITNDCARFIHEGGTLAILSMNLDPNMSAVGDGIPNGWKQQYGLDPFDPGLATEDPDGDGCNNLCEYLTGGNPVVDIKAIKKEGNDVHVWWQASAPKTNALQRSPGSNSSYSNNFADIFVVTNNNGALTNYLDTGAATNTPAFYYRVRLVP